MARCREDELMGKDYEVWITRACVDVSEKLKAACSELDPLQRANLVRDRRQEIAREAEAASTSPASSVRYKFELCAGSGPFRQVPRLPPVYIPSISHRTLPSTTPSLSPPGPALTSSQDFGVADVRLRGARRGAGE